MEAFAQTTQDAEIHHRLRRINKIYANVTPSTQTKFPRLDSLDTTDEVHQEYVNQFFGEEHQLSEAEKDKYQRQLAQTYVKRRIQEGANRWEMQKMLDEAVEFERTKSK